MWYALLKYRERYPRIVHPAAVIPAESVTV